MAVTPAEEVQLNKLYERGLTNGVPDLFLLNSEELKKIEPHCRVSIYTIVKDDCSILIQGYKALHSPHTGIVNWSQVAHSYAKDIQDAGGVIRTNFEVRICFSEAQSIKQLLNPSAFSILMLSPTKYIFGQKSLLCVNIT